MSGKLATIDTYNEEQCNVVVSDLWTLQKGMCGNDEYLFLCRLLLESSCVTKVDSLDTLNEQVVGLKEDTFAKELAYKALALLVRHGYLRDFLGALRNTCSVHKCEILAFLCSFPYIQEHIVTPMLMETWTTDRTTTLKAIILLGYKARRYATKPIFELLDTNIHGGRSIGHAQQALLATALIRLFAFKRITAIIEDEQGNNTDSTFRISCLQALVHDTTIGISLCNSCASSESSYPSKCPYNCKIAVSDMHDHIYIIKDDIIVLCYEELCLYLEILHDSLEMYENLAWKKIEGLSSPNVTLTESSSRSCRTTCHSPKTTSLHIRDLENTRHILEISNDPSTNNELVDQSGVCFAPHFCQLRTLHDKTYLCLLTSLQSATKSSNEGVVSWAISAMTKLLCSLADSSSINNTYVYKKLQSIHAIQFIEYILDGISHPSDSVKEVAIISLGSLLVEYIQYFHNTVTMGLFYSILNLCVINPRPKVRNCCLLTIKYIYCNIKGDPRDLLLKQSDIHQLITVFSSTSSSKLLVAECICLTNRDGRRFLMHTAQHDINLRNRAVCINALKYFAISVVEEHELIDLKHCLAALLVDSNSIIQSTTLDLYGYLYLMITKGVSKESSEISRTTTAIPQLSLIGKQRLMAFKATPIITDMSFSMLISEKLKDIHFCLNSDLFSSLLKVMQDYIDPSMICTLLTDAIIANKKREKTVIALLDLFALYKPENIRNYVILYRDVVEVQIYKLFDKRFPYNSPELMEYVTTLMSIDSELTSIIKYICKRRSGSQIFADWCRQVLKLIENDS